MERFHKKVSKRKSHSLDIIPTPQQLLEDDLYLTSDEEPEFDNEAYLKFVADCYGPNYNPDLDKSSQSSG